MPAGSLTQEMLQRRAFAPLAIDDRCTACDTTARIDRDSRCDRPRFARQALATPHGAPGKNFNSSEVAAARRRESFDREFARHDHARDAAPPRTAPSAHEIVICVLACTSKSVPSASRARRPRSCTTIASTPAPRYRQSHAPRSRVRLHAACSCHMRTAPARYVLNGVTQLGECKFFARARVETIVETEIHGVSASVERGQ